MQDGKIYSKLINENKEVQSVISSIERCPKDEVDWGIRQSNWETAIKQALEQAAPINPS